MLDTGASGFVIDRKVAGKAGIKRIVQSDFRALATKATRAVTSVADSLRIGDLEFQNCYVKVIDKNSVNGEDGLIGTDVFAQYLLDIDFPNGKFKLSELPPRPESRPRNPRPIPAQRLHRSFTISTSRRR